MLRCWCHAAMAGWLGDAWRSALSPSAMRRWQAECERAGGDCPGRVEAVALRLPAAAAERSGPVLTIHTRAGRIVFRDGPDGSHRYLGPLADGERHLLWGEAVADRPFAVLCDTSGRTVAFPALEQAQSAPSCPPSQCRHRPEALS